LEKEDWRYDKFPEFLNGSNVLDFYDPDIAKKLDALEKEEDELLKMEADEDALMKDDESDNSEGVTLNDLKTSLKEVRGKKAIKKMQHKMKLKLKIHNTTKKLSEVEAALESKGIDYNKESLRSRSKTRRTLADLEKTADALHKKALDSDDSGDEVVEDREMADAEQEERGRKRRRDRSVDADDFMDVDGDKSAVKSSGKRSMTPAQRQISVNKLIRSKTQERREGTEPKRLPYKLVPEEHIRLAKKINKRFKHGE